ncbi:23S rRNA methyltransferase [Blastocystis sp. subtype 4]|uniref:23S rRNA methyltransferase n=1 Tax=Blastocystis sp. subtype 4 TaxID=944170 RepID=UPI000711959B|nr:23S rRNA methyltransferase [Blastocystis sp. subtype 4]KNB42260.1 23S rRNA methyltransferase [Blastocystis sp. subtype 4]|eukprot:XP_014525703.1 23S rRNA methyltransferase [Blastocystis sp. subtype 4]
MFTVFRTAVPKSVRSESHKDFKRNIKKDYLQHKGKSHSSTLWLDRQLRDPYYIQAKEEGYRSRAVYKLKEIDDKLHLFKPNNIVLDVGAAPGGWSQYVVSKVGVTIPCSVVSIDLLDIEPIDGVHFLKGDFMEDTMKRNLQSYIDNRPVDVVISDIAPNFSGDHNRDHTRQIEMCDSVVEFARSIAKTDCSLVLKVLQGSEFHEFIERMRRQFVNVTIIKPKASRKESSEMYCVLHHFKELSVCSV